MTRGTEPRQHPGESRYPAAVAVVAAAVLYAALPSTLVILGPRFLIPVLEIVLLVPLFIGNPRRMTRESRALRLIAIGLILLIAMANVTSLVLLVDALVNGTTHQAGSLLLGAAQVWLTNIIVFALAFWEIDRGGPVTRTRLPRARLPPADFRFPQDEDEDAIDEVAARSAAVSDWSPGFLDYFYVSVTNSSAFSPTDTMPLSHRAKMLMATESVSALMLSVIVIARGVSLLT
jgi:hypothetical protein